MITDRNSVGGVSRSSQETSALLAQLGISGDEGFTPVTDALFGVKYVIGGKDDSPYPPLSGVEGNFISLNDNAVSLGLAASSLALSVDISADNPFDSQNTLLSAIAGASRNLFTKAEIIGVEGFGASVGASADGGYNAAQTDDGGVLEFSVIAPADGTLYAYFAGSDSRDITFSGRDLGERDLGAIVELGGVSRGAQVNIGIALGGEELTLGKVSFAVLDGGLTSASLAELKQRQMTNTSVSGGRIKGTVALSEGQILLTSIPYQEGSARLSTAGACR
ncbi:MAG: YfhO family protein [Clostridia bacterium]|nr:YfhO family protein [Clostridia bacterium]